MEKHLIAVPRNYAQEKIGSEIGKGALNEKTTDSVPVFFCDFRCDIRRRSGNDPGHSEGIY